MQTFAVAAAVALGSNLGDRENHLKKAVAGLKVHPRISRLKVSSFYETRPVDAEGPDFLNAAAVFETALNARELHRLLQDIENAAGRERTGRNAPRTLDLDLLFYGEQIVEDPALKVPHPRLHERAFVLIPLNEIAADWMHPVLKKTAAELLFGLPENEKDGVKNYENHPQR